MLFLTILRSIKCIFGKAHGLHAGSAEVQLTCQFRLSDNCQCLELPKKEQDSLVNVLDKARHHAHGNGNLLVVYKKDHVLHLK